MEPFQKRLPWWLEAKGLVEAVGISGMQQPAEVPSGPILALDGPKLSSFVCSGGWIGL